MEQEYGSGCYGKVRKTQKPHDAMVLYWNLVEIDKLASSQEKENCKSSDFWNILVTMSVEHIDLIISNSFKGTQMKNPV